MARSIVSILVLALFLAQFQGVLGGNYQATDEVQSFSGPYAEFLVNTADGILLVSTDGKISKISDYLGRSIDYVDGKIYSGCGNVYLVGLDGKVEEVLSTNFYCITMKRLPKGYAVFNNKDDEIYLLDEKGTLIKKIKMESSENQLQNIGSSVYGDLLVVLDGGSSSIYEININSYEVERVRKLPRKIWGAIDVKDGAYYLSRGPFLYVYWADNNTLIHLTIVGSGSNIVDIKVAGNVAYVATSNEVFAVDLTTGSSELVVGNLSRIYSMDLVKVEEAPPTEVKAPVEATPEAKTGEATLTVTETRYLTKTESVTLVKKVIVKETSYLYLALITLVAMALLCLYSRRRAPS